ncbi:unnamed protein product [Rhizophagus irregularis]|nr:unnamed protein product [Rhizophagus irregularis]
MKPDFKGDAGLNTTKLDFKDASLFTKPDFKVKNWEREWWKGISQRGTKIHKNLGSVSWEGFRRMENGELRFVPSGGLPKNGKRRTKVPSGGLPKNGKQRTKVPSGGLSKNGKQRTKVPSSGLPKNGKWRTKVLGFSGVFRKMEKTKIRFRWASEKQKTQRFILGGFLKNGKRRRILTDWSKMRLDPISKVYFGNQFLSSI